MEYVSCFLKGLSDNYHNIQTQILLLDLIPNINHVYSLIAQQQVAAPPTFTPNSSILYANNTNNNNNTRGKGKGNSKNSMICTNCSKTNHIVETCYFNHGFPPRYQNKNTKSSLESKTTQAQDKEGFISKEDYQHLLILFQQSRKDH